MARPLRRRRRLGVRVRRRHRPRRAARARRPLHRHAAGARRPPSSASTSSTPPPAGVVRADRARRHRRERRSLTLLFTSPLADVDGRLRATHRRRHRGRHDPPDRRDPRAARRVVLAASRSRYVTSDPDPTIETYVQVTGAPDRVESVGDLVVAELADLAANGPTEPSSPAPTPRSRRATGSSTTARSSTR